MAKYVVEECAMRNMAGRKDTAIVYDFSASRELSEWHRKPGCWQDNPAIALIFDLDEEGDEYDAWRDNHKGEYAFAEEELV